MGTIRQYLKQKVARSFGGKRVDLDVIKKELKDEITHILYDQTRRTPIVIPVINEIGGGGNGGGNGAQNRQQGGHDPRRNSPEADIDQPVVPGNTYVLPPPQVPDTEVIDPRPRTDTRAY